MATAKTTKQPEETNGAEKITNWMQDSYKSIAGSTAARSSDFAIRINDFQRTAFERVMETVGNMQDSIGDSVHTFAKDSSMIPPEGAKLIAEWNGLVKRGRQDFIDSTIKSYDLVASYFERVKLESKPKSA